MSQAIDILNLNIEEINEKKGKKVSLIFHLILLVLAFLVGCPHAPEKAQEKQYSIAVNLTDIEFTKETSSNSTKSKAKEGASKKKVDPITKIKEKKVDQVKVVKPTPKVPKPKPVTPKPTDPIVSETTTEEESPIEAVEDEIEIEEPELEPEPIPEPEPEPIPEPEPVPSKNTEVNDSKGKTNASPNDNPTGKNPSTTDGDASGTGKGNKGDGPGRDAGGDDGDSGIGDGGIGTGEYDGTGNGIFGRKVTYVNRSKQAEVMDGVKQGDKAKIWVKTCVNRSGIVTYVELDEINTTITDNAVLKKALVLVSGYKFEPDINAPSEQCGVVKYNIDKTEAIKPGF